MKVLISGAGIVGLSLARRTAAPYQHGLTPVAV
jgi:flavin-dependent dehydrogenase